MSKISTRGGSIPKKPTITNQNQERLINSLSKILNQDKQLIIDSFSIFSKVDFYLERVLSQYSLIKFDCTKIHALHSLEFLVQFEKKNS